MRSLTRLPCKPGLAAALLALFVLTVGPAPAQDTPGGQLTTEHLESLQWRNIGPAISSGRIVDIAVDPSDTKIVYVASASGGLWKSTNHGTTWEPVFDHETIYVAALGALWGPNPERGLYRTLSELNAALDAAGVRWTPGRDIRLREQS